MYKIFKITSNSTIDFAAEELKKYLRMMMPRSGEIEIKDIYKIKVYHAPGNIPALNTDDEELLEIDDAEDAVQEALLRLFALRDKLSEYRKPEALAQVVVKRIALNMLRSTKRHPIIELREQSLYEDDDREQRELLDEVLKRMDELPSKQQMVLRMKHLDNMEIEEIAETVQMSREAVYQNLSRARRAILEQFKTAKL